MRFECPRCMKTYNIPSYSNDFICQCDDFPLNSVISKDDIPVTGDWVDYTGSGTEPQALQHGQGNKLDMTRAGVEGYKLPNKTPRGNNADITRARAHQQYVQFR